MERTKRNETGYGKNHSEQRQRYMELSRKLNSMSRINSIISNQVADILNQLIRNSFVPQMKDMLKGINKESRFVLIDYPSDYDWVNSSYAGFKIEVSNWKYFIIGIEFESRWLKQPIIGFLKKEEYLKKDIDCWEKLKNKYSKKDPNNQSWIYKKFKGPNDWHSRESVSRIESGKMVSDFKEMIQEMLACAEDIKNEGFEI